MNIQMVNGLSSERELSDSDFNDLSRAKTCLSSLLPYDLEKKTKGTLQVALKEYKTLLEIFSDVLKAFKGGLWETFDALVGENACQIRAIKIALIAKNNSCDCSYLEERIQEIKNSIDELLLPGNINPLMATDITFEKVLERSDLSLALTDDELFLLKSYILTEIKISNFNDTAFSSFVIKEVTNHKKLHKYGNVSAAFLDKLVKKIRSLLSYKSVEFIKDIGSNLNDDVLTEMISDEFIVEHNRLHCLPFYWSVKVMLHSMMQNDIPLIIHVKFLDKDLETEVFNIAEEDCLFFIPEQNKDGSYRFVEKQLSDIDKNNHPAIVFEGIVLQNRKNNKNDKDFWRPLIFSLPITEIILANAAVHRQYPNSRLESLIDQHNDKRYEEHKKIAKEKGFSFDDPNSFLIRHVYASKLNKF
jgi:hypothetical protein